MCRFFGVGDVSNNLDRQVRLCVRRLACSLEIGTTLFAALARAAQQRACECTAQNLANFAWAFATVGYADEDLFAVLATASEVDMINFNMQGLVSMSWAFATVAAPCPGFLLKLQADAKGLRHPAQLDATELRRRCMSYIPRRPEVERSR
eukprot:gnl/TRDRNA2_/TRDRNA2_130751_c0_seq1.p1 gnl/TRDRNA2_/TRDRNA2_130751_c0~~gnl/TRDRNA2_/TRDRNA2_130751_c0_seq1.p1  ORF type:complete len:150 (+),score=24.99 gnl/TRDRNA2_/TRDRNA2_130751_c0_seq1:151-600(+)